MLWKSKLDYGPMSDEVALLLRKHLKTMERK
jgi:hypothetical protein